MALNFGGVAVEKMYKVTIEGHVWELTESNTQKIIDILNGMISVGQAPVSAPTATSVVAPVAKSAKEYKDVAVTYKIEKHNDLYCIFDGAKYKRTVAHRCVNGYIKAVPNIRTTEVVTESGSKFKAWGFKKKADATAAIEALPKICTAAEQQEALDKATAKKEAC